MSILKRFADIMSANFNGVIEKFEDPEKMIDQYLKNLEKDLARVKAETATVMVTQKKAEAKLNGYNVERKKWMDLAKAAIDAGNEDDARKFTGELLKLDDKVSSQASVLETAKANADKMIRMHDKLMDDISILRSQRDELMSKYAVVKTTAALRGYNSDITGVVESNISGYNRMKDRIEDSMQKLEAMEELDKKPVSLVEEIAKKYNITTSEDERIESRLAELKAM